MVCGKFKQLNQVIDLLPVLTDVKGWPISMYLHFLRKSWDSDQYSYICTVVADFNKSFQSALKSVLPHFPASTVPNLVGLSIRLHNQEERKVFSHPVCACCGPWVGYLFPRLQHTGFPSVLCSQIIFVKGRFSSRISLSLQLQMALDT